MSGDREQYLHERLSDSQLRYTYFILAAAAAAIAFALKQTETSPIHLRQLPLGVAVGCWSLSFFFGCRYVAWMQSTVRANIALLQVQAGTFAEIPIPGGMEGFAEELARKTAQGNADSASLRAKWQFRFLMAGAVAYIIWHVIEMIVRAHTYGGKQWD